MIYFSDHGDDADNGNGHEASKFTNTMSRIPFVIFCSDAFIRERAQTFAVLKQHRDSYWTNDLLYDVMIDILDITGVPRENRQMDIASPQYSMNRDAVRTLHGTRKIEE